MLLIYGFVAPPLPVDDLTGVDGAPVEVVGSAPVAAVVSRHVEVPPTTEEHALAHARVVAALGERAPSLPGRYGIVLPDEPAVAAVLANATESLQTALARVGTAVEFAVRGRERVAVPPSPPRDGSGRAYLEARLAGERAREVAIAERHAAIAAASEPLRAFATEELWVEGPLGPEHCLLIRRDDVAAFRSAAASLDDDPVVRVTGPWPPYTFASVTLPHVESA
ncbi:GvpL/GvpF family gas vesicle protein [Egicoccus sp. AB-alg2]|uniref:GvpL/GvpF family gas vesicle protein n=1 Tax=Egicoccus sp. AB-alg2 TaxID=3242693 RepID=UPI00359EBC90